jgi:hypothetical protein
VETKQRKRRRLPQRKRPVEQCPTPKKFADGALLSSVSKVNPVAQNMPFVVKEEATAANVRAGVSTELVGTLITFVQEGCVSAKHVSAKHVRKHVVRANARHAHVHEKLEDSSPII